MNDIDYRYIGDLFGDITELPVRVYDGGTQIYRFFRRELLRDPFELVKDDIFSITSHVCYYFSTDLYYYGIVNNNGIIFVAGPSRDSQDTDENVRSIAHKLGLYNDDEDRFVYQMRTIPQVSIEKLIDNLCMINYFVNGEKLRPTDIVESFSSSQAVGRLLSAEDPDENEDMGMSYYSTEQMMRNIVRRGDIEAIDRSFPQLSDMPLYTLEGQKHIFIVRTAAAARAAIHGGMDTLRAFKASEEFMHRSDSASDLAELTMLLQEMLRFFAGEVRMLREGSVSSRLVYDVAGDIRQHISEPIRTEQIADALYLSRSHLSRRFSKETGKTISEFIMLEKIASAKRQLRYTERPVTDISDLLGFSSQSHFIRVFRKYTGETPREYRNKYAAR